MKWSILLFLAVPAVACKSGYVPSDVPGVCVEQSGTVTNPAWVSNEKPPTDKMPSYQREGIKIVDAPSCRDQDEKDDQVRAESEATIKKLRDIKNKKETP